MYRRSDDGAAVLASCRCLPGVVTNRVHHSVDTVDHDRATAEFPYDTIHNYGNQVHHGRTRYEHGLGPVYPVIDKVQHGENTVQTRCITTRHGANTTELPYDYGGTGGYAVDTIASRFGCGCPGDQNCDSTENMCRS